MNKLQKISSSMNEQELESIKEQLNKDDFSFDLWFRNNPKVVQIIIITCQIVIALLQVSFIAKIAKATLQVFVDKLKQYVK